MPNSLGLDDELDPVEVIVNLQKSFSVQFTEGETGALRTVGDIYSVLRNRVSNSGERTARCATAMTFYRLRSAFVEQSIGAKIKPNTRVKDLTSFTATALFGHLSARSGLRMPKRRLALAGTIGAMSIFAGLIGLSAAAISESHLWPIPLLVAGLGVMLICLDPGQIPADCQTIGDLSRKVAGLNFGKLLAEGAEPRDRDLWNALVEVLSEDSLLPKSEIRPETLLLQKQVRST